MRNVRGWRWIVLIALLALPACRAQGDEQSAAIKVAVVAPFSGEFEALGAPTRSGVVLAVEEWNLRGGVLGRPVQVELLDSKCDFETAQRVVTNAIDHDGIAFLIGAVCGDASEGVAQVAEQRGVLQISPASVDSGLTMDVDENVRPLVFRVPFADPVQGSVAAQFALETLGAEKAAVLYEEGSDYGRVLADTFEAAFRAGDGAIVSRKTYDRDEQVFYDMLEAVRETQPDVLYMPGYYDTVDRIIVQARTFGLSQTVLGSDGWDSPALNFQDLEGSYFTTHYFPREPRSEVQAWIQRYEARYLVPPDALATMAYDAANILLSAMQMAGTTMPTEVAKTMETMTFDAVSGQMTFDALHNPVKGVLILQIRGGQVIYVARLMP